MRVLVLATDLYSRSGIARYTSTLATSLGNLLGPENVEVLCFFSWGEQVGDARPFRVTGMVSDRQRADTLPMGRYLKRAVGAGFRGYDLVIANHVALAPVAGLLKFLFGTPYWVACHSVEIWWGTSRLRRAALKRASVIVPVSQYTAEIIKTIEGVDGSRVKVLYNAIPDAFDRSLCAVGERRGKDGPRILSVCNLVRGNEFKGVDTVIRCLPAILKVLPNLRYAVVGEGEIRADLERLAAEIGVAASVEFLGEISDEELARQYRDCNVFVLPSRGQQRGEIGGEGFGRVYVEAAFAGKPVVGSIAGGAAEAVVHGKTGFLVDPNSTEDVTRAARDILLDRELATRLGVEGRKWALEKFSEEALSRSLRGLLGLGGARAEAGPTLAHAGGRP